MSRYGTCLSICMLTQHLFTKQISIDVRVLTTACTDTGKQPDDHSPGAPKRKLAWVSSLKSSESPIESKSKSTQHPLQRPAAGKGSQAVSGKPPLHQEMLLLLQDGPHLYWPLFPLPHHNADQPRCIMPPAAGC